MKKEKARLFNQKKTMISKWTPAIHRKVSAQIPNKLIVIISRACVLRDFHFLVHLCRNVEIRSFLTIKYF